MKRIFLVKLESARTTTAGNSGYSPRILRLAFETVAETAVEAIRKANAQARRECSYRGAYIVSKLKHRGAAV